MSDAAQPTRPRREAWGYPHRKRCLRCRRFFGFLVVHGLYDSYECAGTPDPNDTPPEDWPRAHYTPLRTGGRQPKVAFYSEDEAYVAAVLTRKEKYVCGFCGEWHIGTRYVAEETSE